MNNENIPDEEIIRRVIHKEIDLFKEIVERYQNRVFSIGMRFFKNEDDSYDFVQDVFVKAYSNLKFYKGRSLFKFWLIKIAYNHGINKINKKRIEGEFSETLMEFNDETPDRNFARDEIKELLLEAMSKLSEKYQICLDFYFFWGLSYNQISHITDIPVNTIKSNVLRAKTILRDALKGTIAEEYHDI